MTAIASEQTTSMVYVAMMVDADGISETLAVFANRESADAFVDLLGAHSGESLEITCGAQRFRVSVSRESAFEIVEVPSLPVGAEFLVREVFPR